MIFDELDRHIRSQLTTVLFVGIAISVSSLGAGVLASGHSDIPFGVGMIGFGIVLEAIALGFFYLYLAKRLRVAGKQHPLPVRLAVLIWYSLLSLLCMVSGGLCLTGIVTLH